MAFGIQCKANDVRPQKFPQFHLHQASVYFGYRYYAKRILSELAKGERSANGFIDRILFVILKQELSTRWSMKQPTFDVADEWQNILSRLMCIECAYDENNDILPVIVPFAEEALERLFEWQHNLSDKCDTEPNETLVGIYCKLQIYAIRFCLIIQWYDGLAMMPGKMSST